MPSRSKTSTRIGFAAVLLLAVMMLPGVAAAQCNSSTPLPVNTILGRLGVTAGPCQAIPFSVLSSKLTGASITLNSGNGQTAPGAMSGGNTFSFGANTDTPRFAGIGLGGAAPATGLEVYNAAVAPTGNGQGMFGAASANGGMLLGQGSVYDAALANKSSAVALGVTTNTQDIVLGGKVTAASLATAGTIAGALCATSTGLILYEAGVNCYAVSGITVVGGKTLTVDNTLELAGTDGTKFTFPGASDTVATLAATQTFSGNKTFSGTLNITGTGQINGTAFGTFATQNFATPPAIGGTTPAAGAFSTLSATTPIGLSSGGTNAGTAAAARASGGLNIEALTPHGDSNYTIVSTDRTVGTSSSLTAARTWTLPGASSVNPGHRLVVADFAGGVTNTNTLTVQRAGSDTVNGSTSITINVSNGSYLFVSDGVSRWSAQALGAAATVGVASINGQTGNPSIVAGTNISVATSGGNITIANTAIYGSLNSSSVAGASTTLTSSQCGVNVARSNSGAAMTDTLPGTGVGVLPANCVVTVSNNDTAGLLALSAASGAVIKGLLPFNGFLYIGPGQALQIQSDGSNYWPVNTPARAKLAANTTINVATSGSDSANHGLTTGSSFATTNRAWAFAQGMLDLNGFVLTIQHATGNYPQAIVLQGLMVGQNGATSVLIQGNTGTPSNVTFPGTGTGVSITGNLGAQFQLQGVTLSSTGGQGLYVAYGSIVNFLSNAVGSTSGAALAAAGGGMIRILGSYSITANQSVHFNANAGGIISVEAAGVTITVTGTISQFFAIAQTGGTIFYDFVPTYSGSMTGQRWAIVNCGQINSQSASFPGSTSGAITGSCGAFN